MNQVGLCAYFKVEDWEEAEELLEAELFAIKQHFISKPWLQLTAKSRLKKLNELSAFFDKKHTVWNAPERVVTSDVLAWWTAYQRLCLWGKQQIMLQEEPGALLALMDELFRGVHQFMEQVPALEYTEEEPVFGTEPDPMFVQREIMDLNSRGIRNFAEIFEQRQYVSSSFLLTCKRWSLLVKYV